ncbi:MAG: aminotransferase class V-fold PLP-dependent enzyme [Burkholderiaceae bacterium]|nr:MAG: aminotransferase class V-fold PLP-dependent enzyme [Burkholderiaceae bacterium]
MTIAPTDEIYWRSIAAQYDIADDCINLENGFFSPQARPVFEAFQRYNVEVNRHTTHFMRTEFPARLSTVVHALAEFAGVATDEIVITRNATEAMNIFLQGYPFRPGDGVISSTQEYDSVQEILRMLEQRGRFTLNIIDLPLHPANDEEIVACYERALTPKTRALVLTHMLHRTGQILPVAKIAQMARAHGVDVIVDAAHTFAHIDFQLPALHSDFIAANLHKWLGAPLGSGLLYVCKERIADIAPLFGDTTFPATDIRKLAHFNTVPAAPILAIPDAIAFHNSIGSRNKEARLRYLKDCWVNHARQLPHIDLLTPTDPQRSCAIATFSVKGKSGKEIADILFNQHNIFTVAVDVNGISAVRVTPQLYNTVEQMERLVAALGQLR